MSKGLNAVVGQSAIKDLILNSIKSGKVSHAYILEGEDGMGKNTLAYAFANHLVCDSGQACGSCSHCLLAVANNHPDIITVLPSEGKQNLSVDNIRELYSGIMVKPYSANRKVVIIPDCEKMNVQSQNALLKMLEEPPSYIVFILLTSNSNFFLETVLSRSLKLSLQPYTDEEIRQILRLKGFNDVSDDIILCCNGNPGRAFSLVSGSNYMSLRKRVAEFFELFFAPQDKIFDIISFMEENKDFANDIFDILTGFARDLVLYHISSGNFGKSGDDFIPEDYTNRTTLKGCMAFLDKTIEYRKMLLSNVNYSIFVNSFVFSSKEVLGW